MLPFETLLLRQLQKQQNRDEFCDTVLHTQGVSVPVHSCVLSAFSPRFYGTLSSLPVPKAGQRWLIELQAVDACTLLSLVSLLYSGQLHENREQVLSAAQTLGIELPQWEEEERHGEKVGRRREKEDANQVIEKEVDAREWGDRMTRRMGEGSGRGEEKIRESGTQTECERERDERDAQTNLACSEPQSIQTIYLFDQSTCLANQELGSFMEVQDTTLAMQTIHPNGNTINCDPETGDSHSVSESPCVSQMCLYSLENSQNQTSSSVTLHPQKGFSDQSVVAPAAEADTINDLKQFEGNIPAFINCFLDSTNPQNIEGTGQGQGVGEGITIEQEVKRARARSTAEESENKWVRWPGGRRGRRPKLERFGLVPRLAWMGQGGGRVGRLLDTRSTGKIRMRSFQRQQGRETLVEAGEARGRGRGRHRQRGKTGTIADSKEQNDSTRRCRPRGRPRIRPLPPVSRSLSTQPTSRLGTVDPTELDLLHTMTPMPAAHTEPIQPIDTLLDDIMTGLHFLPPAESQTQHGLMSATTSSGPPVSKSTDVKQHFEGEIGDILDHFLRTFEQQVGGCGLDVGDETLQGNDKSDTSTGPWSKTFTQPHNQHLHHETPQVNLLHTTSTLSNEPQSTVNPSVAGKNSVQVGHIHGSKVKKASRNQNILQQCENRRVTRSQSKKRKLETALNSLQNPIKKKCKEKQTAGTRKKRQRNGQGQSKAHVNKSRKVKYLDKNKKNTQVCHNKSHKPRRKRRLGEHRCIRNKRSVDKRRHTMEGFNVTEKSRRIGRPRIRCGEVMTKVRRDQVETEPNSNSFQADQSSVKSPLRGTCINISSSAMEKVRMLLQLHDEENECTNEIVGIHQENNAGNGESVNYKCASGAEKSWQGHLAEIQGAEDEGRIMLSEEFEGQERRSSVVELRLKRDDKRLRAKEKTTEVCRALFQLNLPSKTAKEGNKDIQDKISTTDSVSGSRPVAPGVHLLPSEVVPLFTQNTMHRTDDLSQNKGDAPRLTSAARLSHTQPCQELLSPHTSTKDSQQLAWCSVDEDEDVDVLEVSSPNYELPVVIVEVDSSTEEEKVEDLEIDVIGLEPDQPCRTPHTPQL